jgi:hypothetical protein
LTFISSLLDAALGRPGHPDFQPSLGNRRRVEIYDHLIELAQARADSAADPAQRRAAVRLISRLDARCKREVLRREQQARG